MVITVAALASSLVVIFSLGSKFERGRNETPYHCRYDDLAYAAGVLTKSEDVVFLFLYSDQMEYYFRVEGNSLLSAYRKVDERTLPSELLCNQEIDWRSVPIAEKDVYSISSLIEAITAIEDGFLLDNPSEFHGPPGLFRAALLYDGRVYYYILIPSDQFEFIGDKRYDKLFKTLINEFVELSLVPVYLNRFWL